MRDKKGQYIKGNKQPLHEIEAHRSLMKGNKFGIKLKEADVRQEAYIQYCAWIASGNSKESFVFDHPTLSVCYKTMERYIRENPDEFPIFHKERAESKSLQVWEKYGKDMMLGHIKGCQPAIFQMFMRNKFGWDKETHVHHSVEPEVRKLLAQWEGKK